MRKNSRSADEPWCFPGAPPRARAGRTRRWCFPEAPPRVPVSDPDEPWCFPDGPPRDSSGTVWLTQDFSN